MCVGKLELMQRKGNEQAVFLDSMKGTHTEKGKGEEVIQQGVRLKPWTRLASVCGVDNQEAGR